MSFVDLVSADVEQVIQHFEGFHQRFSTHFATQTRTMATQGKQYLQGQFICQRQDNLMEEREMGSRYRLSVVASFYR